MVLKNLSPLPTIMPSPVRKFNIQTLQTTLIESNLYQDVKSKYPVHNVNNKTILYVNPSLSKLKTRKRKVIP